MSTSAPILLVTGASRGIGAAIARLAAKRGFDVAVNYLKNRKAADAVVADVKASGRRAVAVQADMAREDDIARMFETVDRDLGRLTHLVYNTGITGPMARIEGLATKDAQEILNINVLGAVISARAAIPRLSTKRGGAGGSMVFLSSAMATLGGAGEYVMYSATKAAIETLTLGLAREVASEGIRVNAVAPGPIATDIHPPGRLGRLIQAVPLARPGTSEEVAETVLFLLSNAASYTTGAVLRVAGGR
ncbi:MAG TPA: SDR family oxidoreductase [Xanthobacteraceae bacterium]|jgi:NAD(P)-dependent dehydrogenase (short-subunit alcohol dehydrogenase family)